MAVKFVLGGISGDDGAEAMVRVLKRVQCAAVCWPTAQELVRYQLVQFYLYLNLLIVLLLFFFFFNICKRARVAKARLHTGFYRVKQ